MSYKENFKPLALACLEAKEEIKKAVRECPEGYYTTCFVASCGTLQITKVQVGWEVRDVTELSFGQGSKAANQVVKTIQANYFEIIGERLKN